VFSLLTLDTHGPDGIQTPHCRAQQYPDTVEGVFDCAVSQVDAFVRWLHQEGFMDNSVVVVMGDHPFMSLKYRQSLIDKKWQSLSQRDVFFGMSVPGVKPREVENMNHFDVMPTVLGAMGFALKDDRAALGRNWMALSASEATELPDNFRTHIRQASPQYLQLWAPRTHP
jgi:phosphoglycerol transferase